MTTKDFTANVISASKVVPDGNFKDSKASGVWDINEALDLIKGGNWPNVANLNPASFVDALFQTTVWAGSGSARSITNNIDLSTKEGLVWIKKRSGSAQHTLQDTIRGATKHLRSSGDSSEGTEPTTITAFNSDGFSLGTDDITNASGSTYVGWTFRSQPKFFDVVTYEGTGSARTVAHSLNTTVGMILVKNRDAADNWAVYHRGNTSDPETDYLILNTGAATADDSAWWNDTAPTSSVFTVGTDHSVNASGENYVAYLFAHNNNDGGFGEPGDQDIIKCGTYTGNGSTDGPTITLGFEPQFFMTKRTSGSSGSWEVVDTMRGFTFDNAGDRVIRWHSAGSENDSLPIGRPTATGFKLTTDESQSNGSSKEYIYMAIRRGGMQTPTAASSVFSIDTIGSGAPYFDSNHIVDMALVKSAGASGDWYNYARPIGEKYLATNTTAAEASASEAGFDFMDGHIDANWGGTDAHSWMWKRARGYFDVVAYKGTGTAGLTVNHNLGVAPEMTWVKRRDAATNWRVNVAALGTDGQDSPSLRLNLSNASEDDNGSYFGNNNSGGYAAPTSSVLTLGGHGDVNTSGGSYIAYLFATVAGVSKVGSYTANGNAQNIDCGFSGGNGARFVLIKRTDAGGHWFQFDTSRGFVTGDDLNLQLNETNAEESGYDHIDPLEAGFTVAAYGDDSPYVNINGATYLFYAIA